MAKKNYADLSKDDLVRLLEARDRRDATRFGLVWEADEIERDRALNADFVALDLDADLSCGTAPWRNLIVEGDNFDALRYLRMAFAGRVKCIYIDPPYNTGNRDFVYNDRFVDKEDAWRHSTWCEFMYQRLVLAKDLLRSDGLIFVSIDDNEMGYLSLLLKQVFGESNWVATLIWKKSYGGGSKSNHVVGLHEYVFCYSRSKDELLEITLPPDPSVLKYYKGKDARYETRGPFRLQPLATNSMDARPNLRYAIPFDGEEIWPEKQWQWSKDRALAALTNDELVVRKIKGRWTVNYKQYLKSSVGEERGAKPYSIIEGPYTQIGTGEVREVLGDGKAFSFPKPTGLIEQLLAYIGDDKEQPIILDFFAGSGTTAHAVHKLNAADGRNRRVILVSSTEATVDAPDKNLCRDVCATRVRRVIEGYGTGDSAVPGLGGDFAYLRTRRIAPGRLTEIDHPQVWHALQLMHAPTLAPYAAGRRVLHADFDEQRLMYVPHFRAGDARALLAAARGCTKGIVYAWQPTLVRQRLKGQDHVSVEAVPESLARRFGMRV